MNEDPTIDEQGKVICQLCNKAFNVLTPSHLTKRHNVTMEAYRIQFPEAALISRQTVARRKYTSEKTDVFQSKPLFLEDGEEEDVVSLEDLDNADCFTKTEELEELEVLEDFYSDPPESEPLVSQELFDPHVPRGKREILTYLRMIYPSIRNNFIIDSLDPEGRLIYQIVTDIACPVKKIDFEFPNAFWHNPGWPDSARDIKLKNDGWTIIKIDSEAPSLKELQEEIQTLSDKT